MKKYLKLLTVVLGVSVFLIVIIAGTIYFINQPSEEMPDEMIFHVTYGDSLNDISVKLKENGLIKSSGFINIYSRIKGTTRDLKTGYYSIKKDFTTKKIHDTIISGKQILFKIIIPEGWTVKKIAKELAENSITKEDDFLEACSSEKIIKYGKIPASRVEGYLFPDTYYFPKEFSAEKIVIYMIDNFYNNLEAIYPDYKIFTSTEIFDKIILASIIEREYRVPEEADLISSVFYNRLERDICLGSCATIVYIIKEIQGNPHPEYLTYKDLEIDSEYNTYIHKGLPPGPISNPGKTAISAAFYPEKSNYLYFLVKDKSEGNHYFSKNLTEHNRAHRLYLIDK